MIIIKILHASSLIETSFKVMLRSPITQKGVRLRPRHLINSYEILHSNKFHHRSKDRFLSSVSIWWVMRKSINFRKGENYSTTQFTTLEIELPLKMTGSLLCERRVRQLQGRKRQRPLRKLSNLFNVVHVSIIGTR